MKKIMFVVPTLSSGGAERVVSIWSSELANMGADIHLLVFYRVENEYLVNDNVKIHAIKENKEKYDKMSKFNKIKLLRVKLKSLNPDIIIPFISHVGLMTNIARVGLQTKMLETIRIDPKYSPNNKVLRLFRNISVLLSNGCIVQNEDQKNYFPKWSHKKIYVFANPISNEFIQVERTTANSDIRTVFANAECPKAAVLACPQVDGYTVRSLKKGSAPVECTTGGTEVPEARKKYMHAYHNRL